MFRLTMRTALTHIEDYTGSVPADLKEKNQQSGFSRCHEYGS